ncbi:hypothetical protein CC86DRAFT_365586 [Ophiobolus disseminans]|uniref:Uncharacterized protein n=1 Tax=Ophiobolus disseminans TaxID=1469910 RepID=A0A6A7AKT3_9PLEO|nr:hypothetical protein CC86DRAFT_365586 [Ophiobolus disseminans]
MTAPTPRVEVELKASRTCHLSNETPFYLVLLKKSCNIQTHEIFLQDGFAGAKGFQPINSDQVIQCFDDETGEQVQVIHQGSHISILDRSYVQFTTSNTRKAYELPFITSSLQPDRKYRLRFKPTTSISHWPASVEDTLNLFKEVSASSVSASDIPTPSTESIPWEVANGNDTIVFKTRTSRPPKPNVTVSLSAPTTYSLSKPFTFTLIFSTDAPHPFTVLANRAQVQSLLSDIEILDGTLRSQVGPDSIIACKDDGHEREEFLRIDGTYTEHRELEFAGLIWEDVELKVGEEYILRHLGGQWWWTEDTIDEIMTYLNSTTSVGLAMTERIEFASAGEVRFKVVE